MQNDKLLPCPFCGCKLHKHHRCYHHEINGCLFDNYDFFKEDFDKWNTRKPMERIMERLEEESKFVLYEMNESAIYAGIERALEIVRNGVQKMQNDLISRKDVENAIKEFNKKRVDRIPKGLSFEEHSKILNIIEEENCEMLKSINDIPTAYDVKKVVKELEEKSKELADISSQCKLSKVQKAQNYGYWVAINHAIEIIHNGGKE